MKVQSIESHEQNDMDMEGASGVKMRMLIGPKEKAPNFHMRHFDVQQGGHTPQHRHDSEHEILVLKGEGEVKSEQGNRPIKTGDAVYIPPNEEHQFINTGREPLQFICVVPRTE
jgi:quercetin dioxygenase-like cupin family protein